MPDLRLLVRGSLSVFSGCAAAIALGVGAAAANAQPTDVFISEYIEGSSNSKAIEIYNGTAAAIDLSAGNYVLQQCFNGSAACGLNISLTGAVAAGDVYVVAHSSADPAILAQADQTNGSGWFNGDDAVVLRKGGTGGSVVDSLGQVGFDPGAEWGTGLVSTADNTLRRKSTVCQGDTNSTDVFDPAIEWDGFAQNTFGGLGAHTASCGGGITLSINGVSQLEGDAGTSAFAFTVSLSAPAPAGGVTFDIATADGTAQDGAPVGEDTDYVGQSLSGQTIPAGQQTYGFSVTVNGDATVEPNETFFVNVTNVTGATVVDGQGQGTIQNDDVAITPIHDVQGPGGSSPIVGSSVTVRGIVTGVRGNGFFVQEEEADYDADPATSEGILVFTGGAPPAAAAVGNLVQVTGTVAEYVPSADALQPPLTELTGPSAVLISEGNPLPAPVPLTATFPDPAGPHDQLERVEGMRVSVASLTVVGATLGSISEPNATATSNGVLYGVVTGVARPFREAGIQAPDPPPPGSGTIPPIPRFDSNPERIRVDSDNLSGATALDVDTGQAVLNLVGPMDYTFRTYTINPDPGTGTISGAPRTPTPVAVPTYREATVAAYNLQRFFDTVNDPGIGEPVLTPAAFDARLAKASLGIRDFLRAPDVLGIVECENLTTLQALAARISSDAVAAGQPDPEYDAYLVEGNDVGGIDVGFLVKTALVDATNPRVEVVSVTQELDGTLFVNPDASTELLNDRPPLVLEAIVHHATGAVFPVTVIVNHLRSLNGVNSEDAGSNGWPTEGARVRAKRLAQAVDLANLVQGRQTADPAERIVLVGDFNAFEVNDGLVDSLGVIDGTPSPDNETAVPGDGVDLVNPDFDNLFDSPVAAERYSYVFDGNAQSLDHALVNAPLIAATTTRRLEHPRINADFAEVRRSDFASVRRLADHDPLVVFLDVPVFAIADLSLAKTDVPDPVVAGTNLVYTVTVANGGPDVAANAAWSDTLPAGTTFVSLAGPAGWTCTTPAVGSGGTVNCSNPALGVGSAAFTLAVAVGAGVPAGTVLSNTATATSTTGDLDLADRTDTEATTVAALANISLAKADAPDPAMAGGQIVYTLTAVNAGPSAAAATSWTDPLQPGTTFVSLAAQAGWSCTAPPVGSAGTVSCSIGSFLPGTAVFTLTVAVDPLVPPGTVITNAAGMTSSTPDPVTGDTTPAQPTTILSPASVSGTKEIVALDPVRGGTVVYDIVLANAGPSTQADNPGDELVDVLPPELVLVAASATSGIVTEDLAGNTVRWNGTILAGESVTITVEATVTLDAPLGGTVANQGSIAFDADGEGTNEASALTDDPAVAGAEDPTEFVILSRGIVDIPTLGEVGLAALATALAAAGAARLRRRRA